LKFHVKSLKTLLAQSSYFCYEDKKDMKKTQATLETILEELQDIKSKIQKFVLLIPEESLKGYKNATQVRKAYMKATKDFPQR